MTLTPSQEQTIINALKVAARSYTETARQLRNVEAIPDMPPFSRARLAEQFDQQAQTVALLAAEIERAGYERSSGLITDQGATAIGPREGDYLELSNKWARITIMRQSDGALPFSVSGDTQRQSDLNLGTALVLALHELAKFQNGRAD